MVAAQVRNCRLFRVCHNLMVAFDTHVSSAIELACAEEVLWCLW